MMWLELLKQNRNGYRTDWYSDPNKWVKSID